MKPFVNLSQNKLNRILSLYKNKRIFIVHGKNSYLSCGAKELFENSFKLLNCEVYEHFDFSENPKWEEIQLGIVKFNSFKPDLIVAVGGGSVIDTAKLIRFFSKAEGTPKKYIENDKDLIPFYVFPTTSGTGSEATHFAVCYVDGNKYSVASQNILPTEVFIDYRFTLKNSQYLTACTGLDALCQAIESYWSVKSTKSSRTYAKKAINLIYSNLLQCTTNPSLQNRKALAKGSYFAGCAINISFTTAPHAYSYGITSRYGIPHGHAVAISLPYFFELNSKVTKSNCNDKRGVSFVKKRIAELNKLLRIDGIAKDELTKFINAVLQKEDIRIWFNENWSLIESVVNIQRLENNPVVI